MSSPTDSAPAQAPATFPPSHPQSEDTKQQLNEVPELSKITRATTLPASSAHRTRRSTISSPDQHVNKLLNLEIPGAGGGFVGSFDYSLSNLDKARIQQHFEDQLISTLDAKHIFQMQDLLKHVSEGVSDIVQDDFSRCFQENPDNSWNWNIYLFPLWILGLIVRYGILLPLRMISLITALLLFFALFFTVKFIIPDPQKRSMFERKLIASLAFVMVFTWTGVIKYHGVIPAKRPNQIYVANHTSLIDVIILQQQPTFSLVGQQHKGFVGFFQDEILRCLKCVWFQRSAAKDRKMAGDMIKAHIADPTSNRLLVFPEGTCVNNNYCVQFKKGTFQIGAEICPIAMRYNPIFVDAFWNSRAKGFISYFINLMCSWAVVCDVYYLPPMKIREGEDAVSFANRVKQKICDKARLKNVSWDGYLKHFTPSIRYVKKRQQVFANSLLKRLTPQELAALEAYEKAETNAAASSDETKTTNSTTIAEEQPKKTLRQRKS
jgi:glycerol-3-phosphate O-acyltransferase 3/4